MGAKDTKYQKDTEKCRKPSLRDRDLKFLTRHTGLPQAQVANIFETMFLTNPTGDLEKEEFITLYSSLRPEPKEQIEQIAVYIFNAFDTDRNHLISFDEFLVSCFFLFLN